MKPSFALNFTDDAVVLLHRSGRGWIEVGQAQFADANFADAVAYLRSTALEISPKGFSTKLLIPPSQILRTTVEVNAQEKEAVRKEIAAALEGRTPYDVADLVFDWSGENGSVEVAVVARETLEEAEAFATEHKLNPLAFSTLAPQGFDRDPFFGPSSVAKDFLPKGQSVQADTDATDILAAPLASAPDEPVEAKAAPEAMDAEVTVEEATVPATEATVISQDLDESVGEEPVPATDPEPIVAELAPADVPEAAEVPEPEPVTEPEVIVAKDITPEPSVETAPELPVETTPEPLLELPRAQRPAVDVESAQTSFELEPLKAAPVAAEMRDQDEAPMALDVEDDEPSRPKTMSESLRRAASKSAAPLAAPPVALNVPETDDSDLPPAPAQSILAAFASRRNAEAPKKGAVADPRLRIARDQSVEPSKRVPPPVVARPAAKTPTADRPVTAKSAKFSYDDPVPTPPRLPGDPPVGPIGVMGKTTKGLKSLGTLVSAPSFPGKGAKAKAAEQPAVVDQIEKATPVEAVDMPPAVSAPISLAAARETLKTNAPAADDASFSKPAALGKTLASAKITPLGRSANPPVELDALAKGLGARRASVGGKPRYLGLILTGILLLALAIVAAWSSYVLTGGGSSSDTETAALSQSAQPIATDDAEAAADLADLEEVVAPTGVNAETALADAEPPVSQDIATTEATTVEPVAVPAAEPAAQQEVAASPAPDTGIVAEAAAARPSTVDQDEIFLSAMDVPPNLSDPVVVSKPVSAQDVPPAATMPPPPFGTVYKFDADGNIVPTAEGIITPEGVTLFAGKPSKVPQPRPDSVTAAALAANPTAAPSAEQAAEPAVVANSDTLLPADTFGALPDLKDARPKLRPEGLVPAASAVGQDDASLAPAEGSRFASLRPRERPNAILAAGEDARRASEAASLALQAAAASAAEAVVQETARGAISPLAVSVSLRPSPRPRNIQRAVEAAVASATRQPEKQRAEPQAEEHAEDDGEPEIKASAPRIPTKANVAKQATFVNAINLSKLNLIGVYGTSAKRYALVRQSNGKYKKVRVGDSLDGGKVQAITANEVRYQKGGRLLSLNLPKG